MPQVYKLKINTIHENKGVYSRASSAFKRSILKSTLKDSKIITSATSRDLALAKLPRYYRRNLTYYCH